MSIKAGSLYDAIHSTHNSTVNRERKDRKREREQTQINTANRKVHKLP